MNGANIKFLLWREISFCTIQKIKAIVKEIKAGPIPAGSFSASKDFEEISMDQLMQMQGGR